MGELKLENLTVTYINGKKYETVAIDDVSVVFPTDSFNVIVGYSGCGKTTLLRSVLGQLAYSGHIWFGDRRLDGMDINKRNFSFVSQEYALYSHMTVFDNIAFPLKVLGADKREIRERVGDMAEKLAIAQCLTRKPKHISGGQQQRVALARALIKRPELCLFDEPLSNVDAALRAELRRLIKRSVRETGCSALYVTHDFKEALAIADRLYVIDDGKIVAEGTSQEIYDSDNEVVNSLRAGSDERAV